MYIYKIISTILWIVEITSIIVIYKIGAFKIDKATLNLIFIGIGLFIESISVILIQGVRKLAKLGKITRIVPEGVQVVSGMASQLTERRLDPTIIQATEINDVQGHRLPEGELPSMLTENSNIKVVDFTDYYDPKNS